MAGLIKSAAMSGQVLDLGAARRKPGAPSPFLGGRGSHSAGGDTRASEHTVAGRPPEAERSKRPDQVPVPAREVPELDDNTQARIKAAEEKAVEAGFARGRSEGWAAGVEQGRVAGREEGHGPGFEEGMQAGLAEGKAAGLAQYEDAVGLLGDVARSARTALTTAVSQTEDVIAAIVFQTVCKIVGDKLLTAEGCRAVLQQVLAKANQDEVVAIRISPVDFERLQSAEPDMDEARAKALSSIPLLPDDAVELGGCLVTLENGSIDGRIETQFRAFAQSLKDVVKSR